MKKSVISLIFFLLPIILAFVIGSFSCKAALLFYSLYSVGMYIHLTVTTLGNAFLAREINIGVDLFWKMFFMFSASICFAIFYVL